MGRRKRPGEDKILEDWVKDRIKDILNCFPMLHHYMPPAGMYARSGIHDHIVTQRGLSWTIEAKAGKGVPTDNQIVFANSIRKAGGISIMVNEFNLSDVIRVANYIDVFGKLPYFYCHDFNQWAE
jgi:hypothetical protein